MGLFKRFGDIISANINELIERMEDPEKGLKQAIREMEQSIGNATADTAKVLANQKRLEKELARHKQDLDRLTARAEECVDAQDDDGAREALKRAGEVRLLVQSIEEQLVAATDASNVLKEQLTGMRSKLDEAKRSLATLVARQKAAEIRKQALHATSEAGDVILENSAFDKFNRLREKVESAEAEAEAMRELTGTPAINVPAPDLDVEAQLKALKARRAGS